MLLSPNTCSKLCIIWPLVCDFHFHINLVSMSASQGIVSASLRLCRAWISAAYSLMESPPGSRRDMWWEASVNGTASWDSWRDTPNQLVWFSQKTRQSADELTPKIMCHTKPGYKVLHRCSWKDWNAHDSYGVSRTWSLSRFGHAQPAAQPCFQCH